MYHIIVSYLFKIMLQISLYFQSHALLNRIENATSENERKFLREISSKQKMAATLLPIKSVGVQVCII